MPRIESLPAVRYPTAKVAYAAGFEWPSDIAVARHETSDALLRCGADPLHTAAVTLVVSELMTNALRHGSPPYSVRVQRDGEHVTVVEVTDCGDEQVSPRAGQLQGGGYGLQLVERLADVWGTHHDVGSPRKVVWAALDNTSRLEPAGIPDN